MARRIIIDTDPGVDDAVAILLALAAPELEVMALVAVAGNLPPAAEFNIWADPQAAAIVFDSGLPITMVPLDVTLQVRSTPEHIAAVRRLGTRCGAAVAELIGPPRATPGRPAMAMHDPCVIAFLLMPELFGGGEAYVAIETQSAATLGMTVIDRRRRDGQRANTRVLETVDADGVYR